MIIATLALTTGLAAPQAASGGTIPGGIIAGVSFGEPPDTGGGRSSCTWQRANPHDANLGRGGEVSKLVDDRRYWLYERRCDHVDELRWVPEVSGEDLGQQAADEVRRLLPTPQLMTAPPTDRGVVGLPIWFWVPGYLWQPVEATAWVPYGEGVLWATARAVPVQLVFDPGDGPRGRGSVTCSGPGNPWSVEHGDHGESACSVTYPHASTRAGPGAFPATVRVVWSTSWHASTGQGGPLPPLISSVATPVEVHEIHALVSR